MTASTPFGYTYNTTGSSPPQPRTYPYLNDEFFYTGFGAAATLDYGGQVGGYAGDGWFKMFEFFEVPSQSIGAIGPVAQGSNFDWYRQDIKPGQLNLNLIIDEEVFFSLAGKQSVSQSNGQNTSYSAANGTVAQIPSDQFTQQLLNFSQIPVLPAGAYALNGGYMLPQFSSPVPMVVTSTFANGTPNTAIPIASSNSTSPGMAAIDPISNYVFGVNNATTMGPTGPPWPNGNNLKASWVQFLTLRHGGSGYIFGYGLGAVGQNYAAMPWTPPQSLPLVNNLYGTGLPAERPFHSLAYPDIDYTIMRPAMLPPSPYTNPTANSAATAAGEINATPTTIYYAGDPGVRNPTMFVGYPTGTYPGTPPPTTTGVLTSPWGAVYDPVLPPAIPVRRLFQPADAYRGTTVTLTSMGIAPTAGAGATGALTLTNGPSNASSSGDQYLNNTTPYGPALIASSNPNLNVPYAPAGALPPYTSLQSGGMPVSATRNNTDIYWPGNNAATVYNGAGATPPTTPIPLPSGASNPHLGTGGDNDMRQHPYWRTEQLQRMMNLTTPRTHQYAVWMTIGFFEVIRQGDLGMLAYDPRLAFDTLGPEIGATNGKNTRYRGFFLVDRLQLTGFNPASPTGFRQAVVYRQRIQ